MRGVSQMPIGIALDQSNPSTTAASVHTGDTISVSGLADQVTSLREPCLFQTFIDPLALLQENEVVALDLGAALTDTEDGS